MIQTDRDKRTLFSKAAIDAEEKGEKFRTGDKARRFYEQALELYRRAMEIDQTYDAVYNRWVASSCASRMVVIRLNPCRDS
jgi:hypothetical protein